jgi:hypothetical protein
LNGQITTTETVADVARRELAEIRSMSVGYPTYFLIDHLGVIRSKADLHPFDSPSFDNAIEALLKEAEAAGLRR